MIRRGLVVARRSPYSRCMPRTWAGIVVLGVGLACSGCEGPGSESSGEALPRTAREPAMGVAASVTEMEGAWVELVRLASDDFTLDLTVEPASATDPGAQIEAMIEVHAAASRAAVEATQLYLVLDSVTDLGATSSGLSEADGVGARRDALLPQLAIAGAGVAIAIYQFYRAATGALRERASVVRGHLEGANDDELPLHRSALGLDAAATREECIAAFDALDAAAAARLASSLEERITMESIANERIRTVDAMEIRQATARGAVQAAAAGARLSVSLHGAPVTPGWGDALRVAGAPEGTRLAVNAVAEVLQVQPDDLPDRGVTLLMAATSTEPVTIEEPPGDLTYAQALAILGGGEGDLDAAFARLAWEANGSRAEAPVPTRVHIGSGRIDDAGAAVIPIPDVGPADALVLSGSFAPRLERIDTAAEPRIVIDLGTPRVTMFTPLPPEIPGCPPAFVTSYDGPGSGGHVWSLCEPQLDAMATSGNWRYHYECQYRPPDREVTYCTLRMRMTWIPYDPAALGYEDFAQCEPGYVAPNPDFFFVEGRQITVLIDQPFLGVEASAIVDPESRALAQSWLEGAADMGFPCRR